MAFGGGANTLSFSNITTTLAIDTESWYTKSMSLDEQRIRDLETEIRTLNRCITGMRNMIKIAAEYKNDDLEIRVNGIQEALKKAAEYEPRQQGRGRRP